MKEFGRAASAASCLLVLLLCAAAFGNDVVPVPSADPARMAEVIRQLSSIQSRASGLPGNELAGGFIEMMFQDIGLQNVRSEEFTVVAPVDEGAYLELPGGQRIRLYCLWPNLARTSKVDSDGISGGLIYAGDGGPLAYDGKQVKDSIVLMRFDSSDQWLHAFTLGAKAVIFIEPETITREDAEEKYLSIPINAPRFWLPRAGLGELLAYLGADEAGAGWEAALNSLGLKNEVTAKLFAEMRWRQSTSRNIFGEVPGTDPKLKEEVITIESYYDSMSVVPALAPGAEQACPIAGLLELARYFVANPPKRTIRFMATGAHFNALGGMRDWVAKHYYRNEAEQKPATEPYEVLFGLDFSSSTKDVGLFCRGYFYEQLLGSALINENQLANRFFDFSNAFKKFAQALPKEAREALFLDGIKPTTGKEWRSFLPVLLAFDSEAYTLAGKEGMTFATANDPREIVDSPLDTWEKVEVGNVAAQVKLVGALLHQAATDPGFAFGRRRIDENFANAFLDVIEDQLVGGYVPLKPMPDVLVSCWLSARKTMAGVRGNTQLFTNEDGRFEIQGLHMMLYWARPPRAPISAFLFDARDGSISYAINQAPNPLMNITLEGKQVKREADWNKRQTDWRIPIFPCVSMVAYELFDERFLETLRPQAVGDKIVLLDGESNSELIRARLYVGGREKSSSEPCAVFFTERDVKLKIIYQMGLGAKSNARMVLLNSSPGVPEGAGFLASARENKIPYAQFQAAKDMWVIDDNRLRQMESHGVKNLRVSELHSLSKAALELADDRLKEDRYDAFDRASREAWALESRAYPEIRKTQDDVVRGVIFYFALLVPFVYFMERLTLCSPDIRKQLLAMMGIFLLVYIVLDRVHPAFRLSKAPILVVLSFFIMATGIIVIYYLLSKFGEHMEKLRARTAIIHRADVGRLSSALAAFSLGVSNMKKRKIRTTLTCVTLSLIGFTVISFVSFANVTKFNKRQTLREPPYQGALIRDTNWRILEEYALRSIQDDFRNLAKVVVSRCWIMTDNNREMYIRISRLDQPEKNFVAYAAVGLEPEEKDVTHIDKTLAFGRWLADGAEDECILSNTMADELGVTPQNYEQIKVHIFGGVFRIAGVFDGEGFNNADDLDNEPLTPVDFDTMKELVQDQAAAQLALAKAEGRSLEIDIPQEYMHLQAGGILILPYSRAMRMGGTIRSVAIAFDSKDDAKAALEDYIPRLGLILYAGIDKDTYLMSSRGGLSVKGLASLLVPIAIAALIVFNTMLGAVYERANEIRIYSSVGLAPTHVAALFIAESCVYATIGAIFGYLLGQISAKVITLNNLLPGLTLNYSSSSAVVATFVVTAVVLLSTVHPARVAARASVADQGRKMKIPRPKGDDWSFDFPFTVSRREGVGMTSFIKDYFDENDQDSGVKFAAENSWMEEMETREGPGCRLHSTIWLAPFDMGISQEVAMDVVPDAEDERVHKIIFHFRRETGEITAWEKMNLGFIKEMRKQLLIWRIVTPAHKKLLDEKGRELISHASEFKS